MVLDLVCLGDVTVDLINSPVKKIPSGEFQILADINLCRGGVAANCAVFASRLGLKSGFNGVFGKDFLGSWLLSRMKEDKVKLKYSLKGKSEIDIALTTFKERSFITDLGANPEFVFDDVAREFITKTKHLHLGSYWKLEGLHKDYERILKIVKEQGVFTSIDMGWDFKGWTDERCGKVLNFCPFIDVFFINGSEIKKLTGESDYVRAAKLLLKKGAGVVALHRGSKGSVVFTDDKVIRVPAFKVEQLNPVGAGDAYNAGFIYGLINGFSVEKCALFGNGAAALHIKKQGDFMPSSREVKELIS